MALDRGRLLRIEELANEAHPDVSQQRDAHEANSPVCPLCRCILQVQKPVDSLSKRHAAKMPLFP